MMLDDIESIAALLDHAAPAERHAIGRVEHIAETAARLIASVGVTRY
jgi:hypothetical protein